MRILYVDVIIFALLLTKSLQDYKVRPTSYTTKALLLQRQRYASGPESGYGSKTGPQSVSGFDPD